MSSARLLKNGSDVAWTQNVTIKENSTKKIRYEHVFAYYRKELTALGIKDMKMFRKVLKLRSNRINRAATK